MNRGACIPMTDYQRAELRAFLIKHAEDEEIARQYGEKPNHVWDIKPFPCDVPGLLRVVTTHDITLTVLYPEPRPIPKDPQFQHAEPIARQHSRLFLRCLQGQLDWARDWQWDFGLMDAPDEMPAGACFGFDYEDDVYGARQHTFFRE